MHVLTLLPLFDLWSDLYVSLGAYLPALGMVAVISVVLWLANRLLLGRKKVQGAEARLPRQLLMLLLTIIGVLLVLLVLPMTETTRGQVLSFLGLLITGVIALSSTTFVANAMAGLMLRLVRGFNPGDFVRVGEDFGRVTERGLFHTEIQTLDRDLTTFPNLHLITNPVTVLRHTGTIISATLSLGYDVSRIRIEALLKQAAAEAGLQEAFVLVLELGDFSVTYKVAGFLPDVKEFITARSNLHKKAMDVLQGDGVEIVSPTFMNQRRLPEERPILPPLSGPGAEEIMDGEAENVPHDLIFDKAEVAASTELLRQEYEDLEKQRSELEERRKTAEVAEKERLKGEIEILKQRQEEMAKQLEAAEEPASDA